MLVLIILGVGVYYCNLEKGLLFFFGGGILVIIFFYILFILKLNLIEFIYDKEIILKKSEIVIWDIINKWNNYYMVRSFIFLFVFVGFVIYLVSNYKKFW